MWPFCAYIWLRLLGFVKNEIWRTSIRQLENLLSLSLLKTSPRKEGPKILSMAEEERGSGVVVQNDAAVRVRQQLALVSAAGLDWGG